MKTPLRIGTRRSQLALWQANHVRDALMAAHDGLEVELVGITTEGDRILDRPLSALGGKGLFLKELENALNDGRADIAVHSMKDVTVTLPDNLPIPVVLSSADPRDALVSSTIDSIDALPQGAIVGTASLRRRAQLLNIRPDLNIKTLRGNVNTRLQKLDDGEYDAIILAVAGLERIDLHDRIRERIAPETCLPAVGQGIVGIQCREDDATTQALIAPLNDAAATTRLGAERAINAQLDGGCHMPLAAFAELERDRMLRLRAWISMPDGTKMLSEDVWGRQEEGAQIGADIGQRLLERGADRIIEAVTAAI